MRKDLYSANVTHPTRYGDANVPSSNLDLLFCSATTLKASNIVVSDESFSSDHFPVVLNADIIPNFSLQSSNRFCLGDLDWLKIRTNMEQHVFDLTYLIKGRIIAILYLRPVRTANW